MEKIKIDIIILMIACISCESNVSKIQQEKEFQKNNNILLSEYRTNNTMEEKAIHKLSKYLMDNKMNVREFYISDIIYPSNIKDSVAFKSNYSLMINLKHKKTVDYQDSIREVNRKLELEHQDEKWIPVIPPVTGNISGMDRTIYYYLDGDSLVDQLW